MNKALLVVTAICITGMITVLAYRKKAEPSPPERRVNCPVCEECRPCPSCPDAAESKAGDSEDEANVKAEAEPVEPDFKIGTEGYLEGPAKHVVMNADSVEFSDDFSLDYGDICYSFRTYVRLVGRLDKDTVIVEVDGSSDQVPEEWSKLPNWQRTRTVCRSRVQLAIPAKKWPAFVAAKKKIQEAREKIKKAVESSDE